jgi:hypothetical protein
MGQFLEKCIFRKFSKYKTWFNQEMVQIWRQMVFDEASINDSKPEERTD